MAAEAVEVAAVLGDLDGVQRRNEHGILGRVDCVELGPGCEIVDSLC